MKKNGAICLILGISFILFLNQPWSSIVYADEIVDNSYQVKKAIGGGINLLDATDFSSINIKKKSIFNIDVSEKYHVYDAYDSPQNNESIFYSSFENMSREILKEYTNNADIGATKGIFSAGVQSKLGLSSDQISEFYYQSSFYYKKYYTIKQYAYFDDLLRYDIYKENYLSNVFISQLDEIEKYIGNNTISVLLIDNLFSNFGTHIILDGTFGGVAEASYSLLSSNYQIKDEKNFHSQVDLYVNGKINEDIQIESQMKSVFQQAIVENNTKGTTIIKSNANLYGGDSFVGDIDIQNFGSAIKEWYLTVSSQNATFVGSRSSNGIVPIWNYIKNDKVKTLVKNRYESKSNLLYNQLKPSSVSLYKYIKDDRHFGGGSNKKIDSFDFFDIDRMRSYGFKKVKFYMSLFIWKHVGSTSYEVYLTLSFLGVDVIAKTITEKSSDAKYYSFNSSFVDISNSSKGTLKLVLDAKGTNSTHGSSELMITATFE